MSTNIHGGIEFRHPGVGTDYYEGEPWVAAMDLWPLYDQTDYASFGCLFGVRNHVGFQPLAAGRGLPVDLSSGLRPHLGPSVAEGGLTDATWVSWAEIAGLDPLLTGGAEGATEPPRRGDDRLTAGAVLGAGTHWPHVFAVMRAMAGRFGDDAVRLVVAFD